MKRHGMLSVIIFISVIFIIGAIVYFNSFKNEFLMDDITLIRDNAAIRSFKNLPDIFKHKIGYGSKEKSGMFYRPVQTISYMIDYSLWGTKPLGYHITNSVLHIIVCVLFFIFVLKITGDVYPAAICALLYMVHPVHTQAVTYISGRADSLVTVFMLLVVLLQRRYWLARTPPDKSACYAMIFVCYILALLSKENAPVVLLLLLFTEYCTRNDAAYSQITVRRWAFYLPLIILTFIWLYAKNSIIATESMRVETSPFMARLITVPRLIAGYLGISFFPVSLHFRYGPLLFPKTIFQKGYVEPAILFCILAAFVYHLWRRGRNDRGYRMAFFGAGWFVIAIIPYMNLVLELNAHFAEHWLYVAEMGMVLSLVCFAFRLTSLHPLAKRCLYVSSIIVIIVLSCLTIRQNTIWKDYLTFHEHNAKYSDQSKVIYNNLALKYIDRGDLVKAKELLEKSLAIDPGYTTAGINLKRLKADMSRSRVKP